MTFIRKMDWEWDWQLAAVRELYRYHRKGY